MMERKGNQYSNPHKNQLFEGISANSPKISPSKEAVHIGKRSMPRHPRTGKK